MKMKISVTLAFIVKFITLQEAAEYVTNNIKVNKDYSNEQNSTDINNASAPASLAITSTRAPAESVTASDSFPSSLFPFQSSISHSFATSLAATAATPTKDLSATLNQYCSPSLCAFYNGTYTNIKPHIACKNSGNFGPACGSQPHLLKMSERRRNLILDLHNLARSRIASGQVVGYESASHMPQLKWDTELEYLASLHVKRCRFEHDLCHNTPRFPYSGQNIGYFWKDAHITSHSKRMKNFIVKWYQEHKDANQSFIDAFHLHPDNKVIGHFTALAGDRVHHVGCAVIRFYNSNLTHILMTCNYDYNNIFGETIFEKGPAASKCSFKESERYPGLCDWKTPAYEYEIDDDDTKSGNYFKKSNIINCFS